MGNIQDYHPFPARTANEQGYESTNQISKNMCCVPVEKGKETFADTMTYHDIMMIQLKIV